MRGHFRRLFSKKISTHFWSEYLNLTLGQCKNIKMSEIFHQNCTEQVPERQAPQDFWKKVKIWLFDKYLSFHSHEVFYPFRIINKVRNTPFIPNGDLNYYYRVFQIVKIRLILDQIWDGYNFFLEGVKFPGSLIYDDIFAQIKQPKWSAIATLPYIFIRTCILSFITNVSF